MSEKCKDDVCSDTPKLAPIPIPQKPLVESSPKRKIQMLTMDGCPHCDGAKTRIGIEKMKQIEQIQPENPSFISLAQKFGIDGTPTFIVDDKKMCDLDPDKLKLNCDDDSEVDL